MQLWILKIVIQVNLNCGELKYTLNQEMIMENYIKLGTRAGLVKRHLHHFESSSNYKFIFLLHNFTEALCLKTLFLRITIHYYDLICL